MAALQSAPTPLTMTNGFGVGGFINCSKVGSGEDAPAAKNFLPDLKTKQFGSNITNNGIPVTALLLGSVGGPDKNYETNPQCTEHQPVALHVSRWSE